MGKVYNMFEFGAFYKLRLGIYKQLNKGEFKFFSSNKKMAHSGRVEKHWPPLSQIIFSVLHDAKSLLGQVNGLPMSLDYV